jgi:hypothetical protein
MAGLKFWLIARRDFKMYTDKNASLRTKFPVIQAALDLMNAASGGTSEDRTSITVKRVDLALLGNTPVMFSKHASLCSPDFPGLLGRQNEVFFAVDADHKILGRIGALTPVENERDFSPVKHLLLDHLEAVSYLLRVNVTSWCQRVVDWGNLDSPLGELHHRDIAVTVYREPDEGFSDLLASTYTARNMRMHFGGIFSDFGKDPDAWYFAKCLYRSTWEFEKCSFFNGFMDKLPVDTRENEKGFVGDVSYEASAWNGSHTNTGVVRKINLTLQRGDASIRFFYDEIYAHKPDGKHLVIRGIDATLEEARQLLSEFNKGWAISKMGGNDALQRLQDMWNSAAEKISTYYGIRLSDPTLDLTSAVPGLLILHRDEQDSNCLLVEVPTGSDEAFKLLEEQGRLIDPTPEQSARLSEEYRQFAKEKNEVAIFGKPDRLW